MKNLFTGKRKRILSVIMTAVLLFSSPGDIMVSHGEEAAGKTLPTHEAADTAIWTGSICLNKQEQRLLGLKYTTGHCRLRRQSRFPANRPVSFRRHQPLYGRQNLRLHRRLIRSRLCRHMQRLIQQYGSAH